MCVKTNNHFNIQFENYLKKKRSILHSNLYRIIQNYSELEIKDDLKFKLCEMFRKYKLASFIIENSNKHDEMYYILNITTVLIYYTPLFMIEME